MTEVCSAMAELGHSVTLVTPTMATPITQDPYDYYDVPKDFAIEPILHTDFTQWTWLIPGRFRYPLALLAYGRALKKLSTLAEADVLYVRSYYLVSSLAVHDVPIVLELHALPDFPKPAFLNACRKASMIVCLTSLQLGQLAAWGVPREKLVTEADAVDLRRFENIPSSKEARATFGLPGDRPVIGYVGGLQAIDMDKGVEMVLDCVMKLKQEGTPCCGWIVGGTEEQQKPLRDRAKLYGLAEGMDVYFRLRVSPDQVSAAMTAADVLVYPAPASDHPYFLRDTSPLKLFEYMAVGRPIVCADLPPLHDVLSADDVLFFKPGSIGELANAVLKTLKDPESANKRAEHAKQTVQKHTWTERMKRILASIA